MTMCRVPTERFSAAGLDVLEEALDGASQILFAGLSGGAKCDAFEQVLRMRNKFEALSADVLTSMEMTAEYRAEGHGSVVPWAKSHGRVHGRDVSRQQRTAHRLRDLPKAGDALRRGTITVEHVDVLHRAYRLLGPQAFE